MDGDLPACGDIQPTPACQRVCDADSDLEYEPDLRTGSSYTVGGSVTQIQTEILTNGPVEASYEVYEDFLSYKSGMEARIQFMHLMWRYL